ncbi:hypothetical protein [Nonomuraea jiangxiensis]|uniref:PH domain-containing protein n=1 Tax=Nonomuraea jiangxiensis TaxID=633440 RepID=A0A1G9NCJ9_9ACTN|nr:hypothetical protein [Nonomuraea jiangxiensis]SDL84041.1 hypothetical protein SAMN05421869_131101 [Nonomuraea jiangxiensis]
MIGSTSSTDFAAAGRIRRLVLTAAGPVALVALSLTLIAILAGGLPQRIHLVSGAIHTEAVGSRPVWSSQPLYGTAVWLEGLLIFTFLRSWRVPSVQRVLVALSFVLGLAVPVTGVLSVLEKGDLLKGALWPGWRVAEIVAVLVAACLGWLAAGRLPRAAEVTAAPPSQAPALPLGPFQRVMFVTYMWSWRRLLIAGMLAALTAWVMSDGGNGWLAPGACGLLTLYEAAQVSTRLQIDASGITVTPRWVPALARRIPYGMVRFAEVRSEPPRQADDRADGWRMVSGKGPVLAVSLADDRWFLYSTKEAETAAALVNGWLNRERRAEMA